MAIPLLNSGVSSSRTASHRLIGRQGQLSYLADGKIISSTSRDPGNADDVGNLRPGLLMGIITATKEYAPAIVGVLTAAATAGATTVNVSPAQAAALQTRLGGSSGTIRFVGPPTAHGTVASFTETISAINTTTGDLTVSGLDAALVAGSFVCLNDGSHQPVTFIPDGYPVRVVDETGVGYDVEFPKVPVAGIIDVSQFLPVWPSDTSLRNWLKTQLNNVGQFVWDDSYNT
jgi:hypothetical protein